MPCKTCGKIKCCCDTQVVTKYGQNGRNGKNGRKGDKGDAGPQGPAGTLSLLPVNNTVYVMKNGNNTTGLVQRFDKPFLTIAAARAAALAFFTARTSSNRVKVIVENGIYIENLILDKYIDYDLGDCIVDGQLTDNNIDFGSSPANTWTNIITGQATFQNTLQGTVPTFTVYKPNTKILLFCDTITSSLNDCFVPLNGQIRIYCNRIFSTVTSAAFTVPIELSQGFLESDYTASLIEIIGADIYNVSGAQGSVILFSAGATSKNQTLTLINCRVKALNDAVSDENKSCISFNSSTPSNGKINLYNTILYSANGKSIYVGATNTATVYYYHSNMSNVATGGAGTLTNALTISPIVNAAVLAGF